MQLEIQEKQNLLQPYKCHLCGQGFQRSSHRKRHIIAHTGEKPYTCQFPNCTKRFSRSDDLGRHSKTHSKIQQSYKCHLCGYVFTGSRHQKRHMRTHTGEKPYICQFLGCTKRYPRADQLRRHSIVHNCQQIQQVIQGAQIELQNSQMSHASQTPLSLSVYNTSLSRSSNIEHYSYHNGSRHLPYYSRSSHSDQDHSPSLFPSARSASLAIPTDSPSLRQYQGDKLPGIRSLNFQLPPILVPLGSQNLVSHSSHSDQDHSPLLPPSARSASLAIFTDSPSLQQYQGDKLPGIRSLNFQLPPILAPLKSQNPDSKYQSALRTSLTIRTIMSRTGGTQ